MGASGEVIDFMKRLERRKEERLGEEDPEETLELRLRVSRRALGDLEAIRAEHGFKYLEDVVQRAVMWYDCCDSHQRKGGVILIVTEKEVDGGRWAWLKKLLKIRKTKHILVIDKLNKNIQG